MEVKAVINFLTGPKSNDWIVVGPYEVYLRKSNHVVAGKLEPTVDLANITRENPDEEGGQGLFWTLLENLESLVSMYTPTRIVYIENVQNSRLATSLSEHGWFPANQTYEGDTPSFVRHET